MSDDIDPTTVNNSSITVTPSGGSAIAGTVTLASDGVTLTFVPGAGRSPPHTVYNVSVGGFNDVQGNSVTTFASSFTTGTTLIRQRIVHIEFDQSGERSHRCFGDQPGHLHHEQPDQSGVSEPANRRCLRRNGTSDFVAGTYSVNGATVTFTPLTPVSSQHGQWGCMSTDSADEAGNLAYNNGGTFTTASTVDHTAPTVTITPANGTANVGLNSQVVLTFSKSINPSTITPAASICSTETCHSTHPCPSLVTTAPSCLNYNNSALPAGATLTVTATNLITDLLGNALANTTSQFTTTSAALTASPTRDQHASRQWRDRGSREYGNHAVYQRSDECWLDPPALYTFHKTE